MLSDAASGSASSDMLVAGLGLGAIIFAMVRLEGVALLSRVPRMPHVPTMLLAGALTLLVACALVALIVRHTRIGATRFGTIIAIKAPGG